MLKRRSTLLRNVIVILPAKIPNILSLSHNLSFRHKAPIASFWQTVLDDHPHKENLKAYHYYRDLRDQNTSVEELKSWTHNHFVRLNVYVHSKTVSVREADPDDHSGGPDEPDRWLPGAVAGNFYCYSCRIF